MDPITVTLSGLGVLVGIATTTWGSLERRTDVGLVALIVGVGLTLLGGAFGIGELMHLQDSP